MQKLFCYFGFIFIVIVLLGCGSNATPINVVFKDQTLLNSENYCITTVYQEDKRIRDKYTDIYIKVSTPTKAKVAKELNEFWEFEIPNANTWYSLTNVLNQNLSLTTFARAETTTYIFNFEKECEFNLKAMAGDLVYDLNSGESYLDNTFEVSSEFKVQIDKTIEFA